MGMKADEKLDGKSSPVTLARIGAGTAISINKITNIAPTTINTSQSAER